MQAKSTMQPQVGLRPSAYQDRPVAPAYIEHASGLRSL